MTNSDTPLARVVRGTSELRIGAGPIQIAPIVAQRIRPDFTIAVGLVSVAVGYLILTQLNGSGNLGLPILGLVVSAIGIGPIGALGAGLALGSVPMEKAGSAASMNQIAGDFGIASGVALIRMIGVTVYQDQIDKHIPAGAPANMVATAKCRVGSRVRGHRANPKMPPEPLAFDHGTAQSNPRHGSWSTLPAAAVPCSQQIGGSEMTESAWKVVMDQEGVTISGDQFVLTTNGSDPGRLDTVVSELQSMTRTPYGQYCGLSRAIEMVGERWSLLIIRDLLVSPRSEAELHRGLPLISERLLTMRLKEMTYSGVIRQSDPNGAGGLRRYELTEYGRALEDVVLALGRWGAAALGEPRPEDVITEESVMTALRSTFQADEARHVQLCFEVHVAEVVVHAVVDRGRLDVYRGPTSDADVVIEPGAMMKSLLTGEVSAADALADGQVAVTGPPELLTLFVSLFQLPTMPSRVAA